FLDGLLNRFWDLKDSRAIHQRLLKDGVTSMGVDESDDDAGAAALDPAPQDGADRLPGLLSVDKGREGIVELARLFQAAPENLRPGIRKVAPILIEAYRHEPRLASAL